MENHPTQAQVEKAKVDLAAAQAVLAAAGLVPEAERVDRRPVEVSAVAVRLPALWPDNPAKWFLHCEGKFRLHRITSQQTMFDHCVHAMSAEQSDVVMDLMEKGPFPNCYNELKAAYIERRTPSTAERVQRLRALGPQPDQRPSDLLRLMERILGRSLQGDQIATEEFLSKLPAQTQLIVRAQTDLFTVEQLAQMADRLASVPSIQETSKNFAIAEATPRDDGVVTLASLHQQLSKLATSNDMISSEVAELRRASSYGRRARGGSRAGALQGRRPRMYRGLNSDGICWYHLAWGATASKCSDGCRQAGNSRAGR